MMLKSLFLRWMVAGARDMGVRYIRRLRMRVDSSVWVRMSRL